MFVIHGSSRQNGNTEALTHMMIDGIETEQIYLRDHTVYPITDQRHDAGGFQPVDDDYEQLTKRMLEHDTIIFATPLYWYGMSGHMKTSSIAGHKACVIHPFISKKNERQKCTLLSLAAIIRN